MPTTDWIRFPYYHHVFDNERSGFEKHLLYMKSLATFISLDDAVTMLEDSHSIDGHYLCLTFDDGFKSCVTNALPILVEQGAPAAFFIASSYVGASAGDRNDALKGRIGAYDRAQTDFLTWDDCRRLLSAGMTIGSHTATHSRLIDLSTSDVTRELRQSKETIERRLGITCHHFACPKGKPGIDFLPNRDPSIAAQVGYRSFATSERGTFRQRPDPMQITRDHFIAVWPAHQVRYFLSN